MKYAESRVKMPHVQQSATSLLSDIPLPLFLTKKVEGEFLGACDTFFCINLDHVYAVGGKYTTIYGNLCCLCHNNQGYNVKPGFKNSSLDRIRSYLVTKSLCISNTHGESILDEEDQTWPLCLD